MELFHDEVEMGDRMDLFKTLFRSLLTLLVSAKLCGHQDALIESNLWNLIQIFVGAYVR